MNLKKCLERLNEKEYEKVRKLYSDDKLSIDDLVRQMCIGFTSNGIFFTDEELNVLRLLSEKKEVKKVSKYLLKYGYVYKIDDKYILPDDFGFCVNSFFQDNSVRERKALVLSFYMSSNGGLKLDNLIELMGKSGVKITKNEALDIARENDYMVDNDMIYLNELVSRHFGEVLFCDNPDIPKEHKVFDLKEMFDIIYLKEDFFPNKLFGLLNDKISNTDKAGFFTDFVSVFSFAEFFSEETFDILLKKFNMKLDNKDKEEILEFIWEVTYILPCWLLKGYSFSEIQDGSKKCIDAIKKMVKEDEKNDFKSNLYNSVFAYVTINGLIEVDKLIDIFKEHHNIVLEKELLLELIKLEDYIKEKDGYLYIIDDDKDMFNYLINEKKKVSSYKIIDDFREILNEFNGNCDKFDKLLLSYGIKGEACDVTRTFLLYDNLSKFSLVGILSSYNINLDSKKFSKLFNDIKVLRRNFRLWSLNGYKESEINVNVNKKVKIGRNEKCPCGSGKKYKVCCGR